MDAFLKDLIWVSVLSFLHQPDNVWPVNPKDVHQLPSDDPEVKKAVEVNAVQAREEIDAVTCIISYFSSWTGLKGRGLDAEIQGLALGLLPEEETVEHRTRTVQFGCDTTRMFIEEEYGCF